MGKEDLLGAGGLGSLAGVDLARGEHTEALSAYERAIQIRAEALGRNHPMTLTVRGFYTVVLELLGRNEEAGRVRSELQARGVVAGLTSDGQIRVAVSDRP